MCDSKQDLEDEYSELFRKYRRLESEFQELMEKHYQLWDEYNDLREEHNNLKQDTAEKEMYEEWKKTCREITLTFRIFDRSWWQHFRYYINILRGRN